MLRWGSQSCRGHRDGRSSCANVFRSEVLPGAAGAPTAATTGFDDAEAAAADDAIFISGIYAAVDAIPDAASYVRASYVRVAAGAAAYAAAYAAADARIAAAVVSAYATVPTADAAAHARVAAAVATAYARVAADAAADATAYTAPTNVASECHALPSDPFARAITGGSDGRVWRANVWQRCDRYHKEDGVRRFVERLRWT